MQQDAAWYEIYGHLWSIMSNTMRYSMRLPCGGSYVAYGPFPYGAAASLWGLIWSHTVPSPMAPQSACEDLYGYIRSLPLWRRGQPVRAYMITYSPFSYGTSPGLWGLIWSYRILFPYGTVCPGLSHSTDKPPSPLPLAPLCCLR